jgi:hypothetical protein
LESEYQIPRAPDLSGALAGLIGDVEAFAAETDNQLAGIARREARVRERIAEGEKLAEDIIGRSNRMGDDLEKLEDRAFTLLDTCDALAPKAARNTTETTAVDVSKDAQEAISSLRRQVTELQRRAIHLSV